MDQAAFSAHLSERVKTIREAQGDTVQVAEVGSLLEHLMSSIEGDISAPEIQIHTQIIELVDYIKKAREEISDLQPHEINEQHIPAATDELTAIVEATEEATNTFLDAAEKIGNISMELGGEHEEKLNDIVTQIFEASNFQDITGQRINKVVSTLQYIESSVTRMAESLGMPVREGQPRIDVYAESKSADERPDADLLNGPQLDGDGNSQDDIDALLASFD
ncbi:protein phosphatase CheZ [Sneathiella sp.]|jgi:chemotaxis protein CheZ|uniref:protein phosphatase CheZ n=1 Tax=Sneathiella sp. TaxID=1964365 RepID=UPI0039E4A778